MKKILKISMVVALAVMLGVGAIITSAYQTSHHIHEARLQSQIAQANVMPLAQANFGLVPVFANPTATAVPTEYVPPNAGNPGTTVNNPVFTESGKQVYMSKETGLLCTKDGKPIMDSSNSALTKFDVETQEYTNGADQKLSVWFNSFLDRYYLRSGGNFVTEINVNREIFLINIRTNQGTMAIYAFREKVDHGISIIWKPGKWFNDEYRYFDMNGRLIDNQHIAEWDTATFAKSMAGNLLFFLGTGGLGLVAQLIFGNVDNFGVPFVKVLDKTTLANLLEEMKHATWHPYDTVDGIVAEDGQTIYIRPTTNQAVDRFNYPLFSIENGLPVLLYDDVLVTSNLQGVPVQSGILKGVVSVTQLLESGTDFYMASIPTPFGNMDAVVFNYSNDVKSPDWRLPNGENADGVIKEMEMGRSLDGKTWDDLFGNILGGDGLSILDWIIIALAILFIAFVITVISRILSFVPKKQNQSKGGR